MSSQHQHQLNNYSSGSYSGNVPVSEVYWSLVAKADKKFSKIRDLPYYQRNRYDTYFSKVFKVYTRLWKFQQENRQKLVEAGLKRWEIGEIASRIGQLYFGQYMGTSDASFLSESYIFYQAILTREYFKEGMFQDATVACKQLRFLARFLTVCLVLSRREMVYQVVNQLKMLLDECKRAFQETDFREWKLVVKEIVQFLKADTAFMNIRPLRYSVVLDLHPDCLSHAVDAKRQLKLKDALLCSYHLNEVKFSELTLDTFRMLQCLEWEPSGSFYKTDTPPNTGPNGGTMGPSRSNSSQDITDPTLPPNPRKAILYRQAVTHFIAVLSTMCEELPSDGIILIYLSAPGDKDSTFAHDEGPFSNADAASLNIGFRGNGGSTSIYPCDLVPFTRKPLLLIVDSNISRNFKVISGVEKGEPIALLLSPSASLPIPTMDSSRQHSGSLFTSFLTAPLQTFIFLLGFTSSDIQMDKYDEADKFLSSSLNQWGSSLTGSENLSPTWTQILGDPFLRRLLLRFIFCRAVLGLNARTSQKPEFVPECIPSLPDTFLPTSAACQIAVFQLADMFSATDRFMFSEGMVAPRRSITDTDTDHDMK